MFMCGKSYVIPFYFQKIFKVKQLKPVTHTRPMSDPEFIFVFHKLSGTQMFVSKLDTTLRDQTQRNYITIRRSLLLHMLLHNSSKLILTPNLNSLDYS